MNSPPTWPVLLGLAIDAKSKLHDLSPKTCWNTLPRVKNSEQQIVEFETERDERIPAEYRDFLLHANGWEGCYLTLGVFGLPELRGEENGAPARELLALYADGKAWATLSVTVDDVYAVGAGPADHLVVMERAGAQAGRVFWFEGGSLRSVYSDFREFFMDLIDLQRERIEWHRGRQIRER